MFLVLGCRRFDSGTADRAADSACAAEGGSSGSSSLLRSMASSLLLPVLSPITDKAESFAAHGEGSFAHARVASCWVVYRCRKGVANG